MSISPGMLAIPLADGPGFGAPSSLPAPGAGGDSAALSQADFSSMLKSGNAETPVPDAAANPPTNCPPAYRQGAISHEVRLGDQVLGGLEKLGRSVEAMNNLGSGSSALPAPPSSAASQSGASTQGAGNDLADMHKIFEAGMQQQKQLYATVFEFELVEESAQSMMKSLKSLLTQGGG